MAQNKIQDLRNHLFETIELLKDGAKDSTDKLAQGMTIEKAKAIADVAQVIINTAKVEVDFIRAIKGDESNTSGFIFSNVKELSK